MSFPFDFSWLFPAAGNAAHVLFPAYRFRPANNDASSLPLVSLTALRPRYGPLLIVLRFHSVPGDCLQVSQLGLINIADNSCRSAHSFLPLSCSPLHPIPSRLILRYNLPAPRMRMRVPTFFVSFTLPPSIAVLTTADFLLPFRISTIRSRYISLPARRFIIIFVFPSFIPFPGLVPSFPSTMAGTDLHVHFPTIIYLRISSPSLHDRSSRTHFQVLISPYIILYTNPQYRSLSLLFLGSPIAVPNATPWSPQPIPNISHRVH
ncbi:hypothetical protein MSAN_02295900 [Mycena sanguinolenta]|uniref:Uncharacterized protein n=1 Tax=Mycena sanguinolenta TaxID=230812 RepID=A0A8H6X920_9AGAR|nr:hypothetical protein MSAN_02295900 [Mycena sanguinolenta]